MMTLNIIQRYILKGTLTTLSAVLFILLLIMVGGLFAKLLGHVAAGKITASVLFPLLLFTGLKALPVLLSVALFLGVVVTLGRFYKENEMTAIRAGGGGFMTIFKPLMLVTVVVMVILSILSLWVHPRLQVVIDQMRAQTIQQLGIAGITPGQFINLSATGSVVFAETVEAGDAQILKNVYLFNVSGDQLRVAAAKNARQVETPDKQKVLELEQGTIFERPANNKGYRVLKYQKQGILLPEVAITERVRLAGIPTSQLFKSNKLAHQAELQSRLSIPLVAFVLVLLALPLSYTTPREGQFTKLTGAIFVYVAYQNLLGLAQSWMEKGTTPFYIGIWWVHILFLGAFLFLMSRQYSIAWLMELLLPASKKQRVE